EAVCARRNPRDAALDVYTGVDGFARLRRERRVAAHHGGDAVELTEGRCADVLADVGTELHRFTEAPRQPDAAAGVRAVARAVAAASAARHVTLQAAGDG